MATRGTIGYETSDGGYLGVYVHYDSYPDNIAPQLMRMTWEEVTFQVNRALLQGGGRCWMCASLRPSMTAAACRLRPCGPTARSSTPTASGWTAPSSATTAAASSTWACTSLASLEARARRTGHGTITKPTNGNKPNQGESRWISQLSRRSLPPFRPTSAS